MLQHDGKHILLRPHIKIAIGMSESSAIFSSDPSDNEDGVWQGAVSWPTKIVVGVGKSHLISGRSSSVLHGITNLPTNKENKSNMTERKVDMVRLERCVASACWHAPLRPPP